MNTFTISVYERHIDSTPHLPQRDELAILLGLRPGGGHLIAALPALLRLLRVDERLVGR